MKNQETKRVLSRTGARELTPKEIEYVSGGSRLPRTETACTIAESGTRRLDGDVGEC